MFAEGDMLTERDLSVADVPKLGYIPPDTLELEPDSPLSEVELRYIVLTLVRTKGNLTEAAKLLGISRRALRYKLEAYAQGGDASILSPERTLQYKPCQEQLETATIRDWEPLRTNLSLGDPSQRHWLLFIGAVLVLLTVSYLF